jgi:hypothetical protein
MQRSGTADLPLHHGHVPLWLSERIGAECFVKSLCSRFVCFFLAPLSARLIFTHKSITGHGGRELVQGELNRGEYRTAEQGMTNVEGQK